MLAAPRTFKLKSGQLWGSRPAFRATQRHYSTKGPEAKKVAMIFGLDPGFGQGVARRFAKEGYSVALLGGKGEAAILDWTKNALVEQNVTPLVIETDVSDKQSVQKAFEQVSKELGTPNFVLYNTAGFLPRGLASTLSVESLDAIYTNDVKGPLLVAQHALQAMQKSKSGTLVFGSTPACKDGHNSASVGKFALRGLFQTIAREYGPLGIHVIHAIVDEGLKEQDLSPNLTVEEVKQRFQHHYSNNQFLDPVEVADAILYLHNQDKLCWTNEVEFRPANGPW